MTCQIQIPRKVEREIEVITEYIARQSKSGAARWVVACQKAIESLRSNAENHGFAPENDVFDDWEIRQLLFKTRKGSTYRIVFVIDEELVRLLAVRGPGQDLLTP